MNKTHILIISDIHLGSEICNAKIILKVLKGYLYQRLIIVGDLYEAGGIISDEQFEIVKYLRENRDKIICVDGNHDPAEEGLVRKILGINVLKKYEWRMAGRKFCAIHGHQFDKLCFFFSEPLIDKVFSSFTWLLKMINVLGFNAAKWVDDFHNKFSRHIMKKAIKYANRNKIDVIICGHTHIPLNFTFSDKNGRIINYYNCGCLVDSLCSYITIDENGKIELN